MTHKRLFRQQLIMFRFRNIVELHPKSQQSVPSVSPLQVWQLLNGVRVVTVLKRTLSVDGNPKRPGFSGFSAVSVDRTKRFPP